MKNKSFTERNFLFLAQGTSGSNTSTSNRQPPANSPIDVKCTTCGRSAKHLVVSKEGPNKGRHFYNCSTECKFFKWADEVTNTGSGPSSSGASTSRPAASSSRNSSEFYNVDIWRFVQTELTLIWKPFNKTKNILPFLDDPPRPRAKRKCGLCGQEGHTRPRCPNNNS